MLKYACDPIILATSCFVLFYIALKEGVAYMNFPQTIDVYNTAKKCIASYTLSKIQNDAFSLNPIGVFTNKDDEVFGYIIYDESGWLHAYALHAVDGNSENLEHVLIFYTFVGESASPEELDHIVMTYCNTIGMAMYQYGQGPNKHPSIQQKERMEAIRDVLESGKLDTGFKTSPYQTSLLEMANSLASFYLDMATKLLEIRKEELQQDVESIEQKSSNI